MQTVQSQKPFSFTASSLISGLRFPARGVAFLSTLVGATILFEAFNFSTTEHALGDVLGDLRFVGISWATILALAFCGLDFAGIARLLCPDGREGEERAQAIYLLAAWLLAGVINAAMTWWAITAALLARPNLGNELVSRKDMIVYVPILVAGAVWLIRILLIGMLSMSGSHAPARKPSIPVRKAIPAPSAPIAQTPAASVVRPFTGGRS
jgi:hypothetical protein